jgi:hypothetical protein
MSAGALLATTLELAMVGSLRMTLPGSHDASVLVLALDRVDDIAPRRLQAGTAFSSGFELQACRAVVW